MLKCGELQLFMKGITVVLSRIIIHYLRNLLMVEVSFFGVGYSHSKSLAPKVNFTQQPLLYCCSPPLRTITNHVVIMCNHDVFKLS